MNIYPEFKKIAEMNDAIERLGERLSEKLTDDLDIKGLSLYDARLLDGCKEKNGHLYCNGKRLDNYGLVDSDYYCFQRTGYCEDDFYGTLYFKTTVPGQFVAVPFEM